MKSCGLVIGGENEAAIFGVPGGALAGVLNSGGALGGDTVAVLVGFGLAAVGLAAAGAAAAARVEPADVDQLDTCRKNKASLCVGARIQLVDEPAESTF